MDRRSSMFISKYWVVICNPWHNISHRICTLISIASFLQVYYRAWQIDVAYLLYPNPQRLPHWHRILHVYSAGEVNRKGMGKIDFNQTQSVNHMHIYWGVLLTEIQQMKQTVTGYLWLDVFLLLEQGSRMNMIRVTSIYINVIIPIVSVG